MKSIYTSVDIGSDTIKVVVCELFNDKLNLLAASSVKSKGIKKGLIANFEEAKDALKLAISKVEEILGIKVKHTLISVPSYFAEYVMVKGNINVSSSDLIITGSDVDKVIENSISSHNLSGKSIITTIPIDFMIDNNTIVKNPVGMHSEILCMRGVIVTTPKKNLFSVLNLLDSIGVEVDDVSINGIGDYYIFEKGDMKKQVGAVVNIGYETTNISLFNKGIAVRSSIIQSGGINVDNDLSYLFKTSLDEAIKIKEQFALAHKKNASTNDFYELNNSSRTKINQFEASEIVMARFEQILNSVKSELEHLTSKKLDYIIFTGGTSNMTHFNYLVEEKFGSNATIGKIKMVGVRNNKYSSAVGNILFFVDKLKLKGESYSMFSKNEIKELQNTSADVADEKIDTKLSKVFGYFFGE